MRQTIRFGKIDKVILMGGSPLLAEFSIFLAKSKKYSVTFFSCQRQLNEVVRNNGDTLRDVLKQNKILFYTPKDICKDKRFQSLITKKTLAIGVGEVWRYDGKTIDKFEGRLLDFMGIPLPRYRGGAHYSWMILKRDRVGGYNLQLINEEMIQGVFDSGAIIKSKEYLFPPTAKIPQDYFDFAVKTELDFLKEFLQEIEDGHKFKLTKIKECFSMYFPRLYTLKHGFINWNWRADDIVTFISAFDEPYKGASTFLDGTRLFLKGCSADHHDGPFHPFQAGLIYKKNKDALFIATVDGTIIVSKIVDETGRDALPAVKVGQRLFTPLKNLEESMSYNAVYDGKGIIE